MTNDHDFMELSYRMRARERAEHPISYAQDVGEAATAIDDLIARSRLLYLQRHIIEQNVQPQQREQFLADADLMNPYTEKPFELNAAKNSICFAGHGARHLKNGRVSVELPD